MNWNLNLNKLEFWILVYPLPQTQIQVIKTKVPAFEYLISSTQRASTQQIYPLYFTVRISICDVMQKTVK